MTSPKTPARRAKAVMTAMADDVAGQLRTQIQDGVLEAGEWLREARICHEFNVDRSIARAAIRTLAEDGLVNVEENRGAYVAGTSVHEMFDLYELRAGLYGVAIRLACMRASPQHMAQTLTLVDELLDASRRGKPAPDLVHMSEDIFSRLAGLAGPDTQRMIESVRRKTRWYIAYIGLAESQDGPFNHWQDVRDALAARNSDMAADAARRIFHYMQNEVMRLMISRGYGLQRAADVRPPARPRKAKG